MLAGLALWILGGLAEGRFERHLARQGRVNAGIRLSNSATSLWPVIPTAAIIARAINPARRLYSMAVAPDCRAETSQTFHALSNFDESVVARASCCLNNQKRKIAKICWSCGPGLTARFNRVWPRPCFQTDVFWRSSTPRHRRDPPHIRDWLLRPSWWQRRINHVPDLRRAHSRDDLLFRVADYRARTARMKLSVVSSLGVLLAVSVVVPRLLH